MASAGPLFTAECYATWGHLIETAPEKMYPEILNRFRAGKDVAAEKLTYVTLYGLDAARAKLDELEHGVGFSVGEGHSIVEAIFESVGFGVFTDPILP